MCTRVEWMCIDWISPLYILACTGMGIGAGLVGAIRVALIWLQFLLVCRRAMYVVDSVKLGHSIHLFEYDIGPKTQLTR